MAVSSDFIVGFCGETEEDFEQTCDLVRKARFKNSFIFKYSPRPGTKAYELLPDDVPDLIKRRRNNELLAIQTQISLADSQSLIGQVVQVLVEGPSKAPQYNGRTSTGGDSEMSSAPAHAAHVQQLTGRTPCDRIVVFDGTDRFVGRIIPVRIDATSAVTLFGSVVVNAQLQLADEPST